jgi:hypothetical protein
MNRGERKQKQEDNSTESKIQAEETSRKLKKGRLMNTTMVNQKTLS